MSALGDILHYTLDVKQSFRSGYSPEEYLDVIGPLMTNVHLCDYTKDAAGFRWLLPGQGKYDFLSLFKKLRELEYSGPLIIEVYSNTYGELEDVYRSYDYISEMVDSVWSR